MGEVLIMAIIFSVPLTAILGRVYLKAKAIDAQRGAGADAERRLLALERENAELKARVETLETIATSEPARLPAQSEVKALQEALARSEAQRR